MIVLKIFQETTNSNILIYGAPGSGKTHLALTAAKDKYTLLFDIEQGAQTVSNLSKEYRDNIFILQYTEFSDIDVIYRLLKENTVEGWNNYLERVGIKERVKKPFEVVILDSISELQRQMELELSPTNFAIKLKDPTAIKPLRIQDWGAIADLTETVIADAFGKLPIIFIATAHEQLVEDQLGNTVGVPKIRGKLAFDIGKHFNFMGRLGFARSGERVLFTRTYKQWQAKTRYNHKEIIVNPSMEDIR